MIGLMRNCMKCYISMIQFQKNIEKKNSEFSEAIKKSNTSLKWIPT